MANIFESFFDSADSNVDYIAAGICATIAKNIENLSDQQGLSNAELAEKLRCSKSYVTKLLRGDQNLSVKTLAKIAIALDAEVKTVLIPKSPAVASSEQLKGYFRHHETSQRVNEWLNAATSCNDDFFENRKSKISTVDMNNAIPLFA